MTLPRRTQQQQRRDDVSRLTQPQKPDETLRPLGSQWRRFPTDSRVIPDSHRLIPADSRLFGGNVFPRFPTDSQVFPDSICYRTLRVRVIASASARWCGLPVQLFNRRQAGE